MVRQKPIWTLLSLYFKESKHQIGKEQQEVMRFGKNSSHFNFVVFKQSNGRITQGVGMGGHRVGMGEHMEFKTPEGGEGGIYGIQNSQRPIAAKLNICFGREKLKKTSTKKTASKKKPKIISQNIFFYQN